MTVITPFSEMIENEKGKFYPIQVQDARELRPGIPPPYGIPTSLFSILTILDSAEHQGADWRWVETQVNDIEMTRNNEGVDVTKRLRIAILESESSPPEQVERIEEMRRSMDSFYDEVERFGRVLSKFVQRLKEMDMSVVEALAFMRTQPLVHYPQE
jgi:hypothetical protein